MNEESRKKILESIKKDETEILEFTRELISIPTENPPGRFYKPCIDLITKKLSGIGLDYEVIEVPQDEGSGTDKSFPRYSVISSFGSGNRTVYFHGHYDVVPASSREQFLPNIKKGNLFGRGSSDMKSGIAVMIYAIKAIKTAAVELNGKIVLVLVPDEETGGELGAKYLLEKEGICRTNGIGMLLPEPTSGVIWNANRGAISLRITLKGKPAHVCFHFSGVNAFERMMITVNELFTLKKEVESRKTEYNIKPESARHSILMIGGQSKGGSNFNIVPEKCSFTVDRRINPEENLKKEKMKIFNLLDRLKKKGFEIDVDVLQEGESHGVSADCPLARVLAKNVADLTGSYPEFEMCPGLLETRFYVKKGIPALAFGPGFLSVSHGPDEYVNIENIFKCTSIYALTGLELLSK